MYWMLIPLLLAPPQPSRNALQDLATALAAGDLAKSQSVLEQVTRREPGNARAWMLLAQTYAKQKKAAAAGLAAERAGRLGQNDAEVQQGLAYLFIELQPDLKKASGFASRYAELRPMDLEAWMRVSSLYLE